MKNVLQVALTISFHKLILIFLYLKQVLSNVEENKNILLFFHKWQKVHRKLTWRGSAILKRQFSIAHNFCAFCVRRMICMPKESSGLPLSRYVKSNVVALKLKKWQQPEKVHLLSQYTLYTKSYRVY